MSDRFGLQVLFIYFYVYVWYFNEIKWRKHC
ncbi:hypothetical protein BJ928_1547 [Rhizobium sp. WW_1]|nr:hypothetical protein BJ928_1547 [Rhizobium sp. WW_1]